MRLALCVLLVLAFLAPTAGAAPAASARSASGTVVKLRGANTVMVRAGSRVHTLRLRGIRLATGASCPAKAGRAAARVAAVGRRVALPRRARRGAVRLRLRRGGDLGKRLVTAGGARGRRAYRAAERRARRARRGLWAACPAPPPGAASPAVPPGPGPGTPAPAPTLPTGAYDIGTPRTTDLWVDPAAGQDDRDGTTRSTALRTVTEAWRRVPLDTAGADAGRRILLLPGRYPESDVPNYWESRHGSRAQPVIVQAAEGRGTVTLPLLNLFDLRHFYLLDVGVESAGGDVVHCEACDHLLVRGVRVRGGVEAHEAIKVNQSQHVYIEDSDVSGAGDNAIDFVAVQYGHIVDSEIHDAGDWCAYAKGGSASIRVARNEIHHCGTGGFTAGQGTGFQFMTSPWLHYEAYEIRVHDNVVHHTEGAGLGVNGGYNVLLAHNTLYRVGTRSHALEFVFGARSCDGRPGDEGRERCAQHLAAGGWGTTVVDDGDNFVRIPNRNVLVYNNLIYNPAGQGSPDQHFAIPGPFDQPGAVPDLPRADDGLAIRGNLIWNGGSGLPLGIEDDSAGCRPANPTCNETQLRGDNAFDAAEPLLVSPEAGNFDPLPGGAVDAAEILPVPGFGFADLPARPAAPAGTAGHGLRADATRPGAR